MSLQLSREQFYLVVGVGIPGLAVVGVRFMGEGAASAHAAEAASPPPVLPTLTSRAHDLAPPVRAAIEHASSLTAREDIKSLFEPATLAEPGTLGDGPRVTGGEPARTTSGVKFGAIYATGERLLAVIDGRARRVGDEVAPGWRIEAINPRSRRVLLRHQTGVTESLTLHQFGRED